MKSVLGVILFAALSGLGLGAALGYLEGRLPEVSPPKLSSEGSEATESTSIVKRPIAELAETTFDFDRMERGTSMTHAFKIKNAGDAPLHVEVVSTTCKCTVGDLAKNDLAPGEETDIVLEWTAKVAPGPFRHGADIETNDPRHSRIELSVEGDIVESTTLQPPELLFGTVQAGETKESYCYLVSSIEEDAQILHHEVSDPEIAKHLDVTISPVDKAELKALSALSAVKVTATYRAGKTQGPFFGWLTLETNLPSAEKLTVPLSGNVVGDISVFGPGWISSQNLLQFGAVDGQTGKKVRLLVAVRGEHAQDTQLSVASIDPEELKVTLGEAKPMGEELVHFPLFVEIPPGTHPMVRMTKAGEDDDSGRGDGLIVLNSTHPATSEVRLKVRFSVE